MLVYHVQCNHHIYELRDVLERFNTAQCSLYGNRGQKGGARVKKAEKALPNNRLRHEREQRGWTREYVAEQIGCPEPKTVGRWERGTTFPSPHYRQKLC